MKEKKKKQVDKLNFKLTVDSVSIPSDNLMYENAGTDTALNPLAALMEAVSPTQSPTPTPPPTPSRSSAVFFSASPMQTSLSSVKRREALNYRRLNQLSLRQKSARRRKMFVII